MRERNAVDRFVRHEAQHVMKFSRNKIVCQSTARIIVLQLILVFVRVKSVCIEEDCTDQSIKVVDPTSGQCITCFPCPQCVDGQTPSVPCGSIVPPGTDIHCIRTTPDPVVVSKASAYTTAVTFTPLSTSPSVTSWHSSLTETMSITVVPATHPVVVPATSSKDYGGSSSSAVNTDFEDLEKHSGKTAKDHKMGERTVVYLSSGVTLVVIFLGILWRFRKRKTVQCQVPISSQTTPMSHDPCSGTSHAGNSDTCAVRVHPETNSAKFLRSYPEGGQQATKQGNDNEYFQHHLASPEENEYTIPSSLDVTHAEGNQPRKVDQDSTSEDESLIDLSLDPPNQPKKTTKDPKPLTNAASFITPSINIHLVQTSGISQQLFSSDSWNEIASDVDQQRAVKWSVLSQTDKYSTKMQKVPFLLQHNICLTLDIIRCDGKDVRDFADKLGIFEEFERLQQAAKIQNTTTTSIILKKEFLARKPSGTVKDFVDIMKDMGRDDIIELIDKWNG